MPLTSYGNPDAYTSHQRWFSRLKALGIPSMAAWDRAAAELGRADSYAAIPLYELAWLDGEGAALVEAWVARQPKRDGRKRQAVDALWR